MLSETKRIISCAVTGSIHTPSMSPYLPITPAKIAKSALEAAEAGAAAVHIHARNPENGMPSPDLSLYYLGKGKLATSNAEMVAKMVRSMNELDLAPATPSEARRILNLT